MTIINNDNLEQFKQYILDGKTIPELCEIYKCKRTTITEAKKRFGLVGISPNSKKINRIDKAKKCNICGIVLPLSYFWSNGKTATGAIKYKSSCKNCSTKIRNNKKYNNILQYLNSVNRDYKCEICGYNKNYSALEFHHKDPKDKIYEISNISPTISDEKFWEILKIEVPKCIVLCANCHREWHNPTLNCYSD